MHKQLHHWTTCSFKYDPPENYSKNHQSYIGHETPMQLAGLRKGHGSWE